MCGFLFISGSAPVGSLVGFWLDHGLAREKNQERSSLKAIHCYLMCMRVWSMCHVRSSGVTDKDGVCHHVGGRNQT